jgi:hypothetical protein
MTEGSLGMTEESLGMTQTEKREEATHLRTIRGTRKMGGGIK